MKNLRYLIQLMPFTPDELSKSPANFEKQIQTKGQNIAEIYSCESFIETLRLNKQAYADYLKFSSGIYKYGFDDNVMIYQQNPHTTGVTQINLDGKEYGIEKTESGLKSTN